MKNPISSGKDSAWERLLFGCCCIPSSPFKYVSSESKSFPLTVQVISCIALQTFIWLEG